MTGHRLTPSATPTIAAASDDDIVKLADLVGRSFADVAERFGLTPQNCPKHPSNCTPQWIARDLARGVPYFMLLADGHGIGCVGVEQASPAACYLERLAVVPQHRGQVYGTRLVRRAIRQAREWNATGVEIGLIAADASLKAFYASLGFVEGENKTFPHLPFNVAFMRFDVQSGDGCRTALKRSDR